MAISRWCLENRLIIWNIYHFSYICIVKRKLPALLAIKACAVLLIGFFLLALYPGSIIEQLLYYTGVSAILILLYRRLCPTNLFGEIAVVVLCTVVAIGQIINIWYYTEYSGGSLTDPVLLNNDASTAWTQMNSSLEGNTTESGVHVSRRGYGLLLALNCFGFQPTLNRLLITNLLAIISAIILTGATTTQLLAVKHPKASVATTSIIVLGSITYFLNTGCLLIKDAMCCLMMAMSLYGLYGARHEWSRWTLPLIAICVGALIRSWLPLFIAIAIALSLIKSDHKSLVRGISHLVVALGICATLHYFEISNAPLDIATDTTNFELSNGNTARLNAYTAVAGDYMYLTTFERIIRLPFSLAVQYITPLPWAFGRDIVFGPSSAISHFSFPWYCLGGVLLYFMIFCIRRSPMRVVNPFIFAVLATIATAFVTGGTVSRYCLPWLPFFIPAAIWVYDSGEWQTLLFKRWSLCYMATLAVALVVIFATLNHYSPHGWDVL